MARPNLGLLKPGPFMSKEEERVDLNPGGLVGAVQVASFKFHSLSNLLPMYFALFLITVIP